MTSSKTTPPKQMVHDHEWQMFIEFTLSSESDSVHLASDLVLGAVQTLNWAAAHLEQLKQALAAAIQNALEQNLLNDSGVSVIIRVFISGGEDGPGDEPRSHRPPAETAQEVRRLSGHSWGFFLVQKQADAPPILPTGPHHLIELFLYREGHHSFRR